MPAFRSPSARRPIDPRSAILLLLAIIVAGPAHAQYFSFGKNRVPYEAPDWFILAAPHVDVYYPSGSEELARFAADTAEESLPRLSRMLGDTSDERIPILVYPDQASFLATNVVDLPPLNEAIGGVTELFKNRVVVPFAGDHREFARVVRHELVHALVNRVYYGGSMQAALHRGVTLRIPLWFGEGLAEYLSYGRDSRSEVHVRDAVNSGVLPPLKDLDGYAAYRGGQSFWNWFAERFDGARVAAVLDSLRTSGSVEEALERATGYDLDRIDRNWHEDEALRMDAQTPGADSLGPGLPSGEDVYLASPVLSPDGSHLAYVATTDGTFDVFVTAARGPATPRRVIETQRSTEFESVRVLTPGLAWSPDGQTLAIAVKRGRTESIAFVSVDPAVTRTPVRIRHVDTPGVDRVLSVAWHPDGQRLVLSALRDARSDLFELEIGTGRLVELTHDVHDDLAPAWSPDGTHLAWHSNRGPDVRLGTDQGRRSAEAQFDVYVLDRSTGTVLRATDTPWDEWRPAWSGDGHELVFLCDETGIPNVHALPFLNPEDWRRPERAVTDVRPGILDLSMGGTDAAVLTIAAGRPVVHVVRNVIERAVTPPVRTIREVASTLPAEELEYNARRYRTDFSTDIVFGSAGYDPLYGSHGTTQMVFSDLLGNHRIRAATNLVLDLRRSDYMVTYESLRRRLGWSVSVSHLARILSDRSKTRTDYHQYRQFGFGLGAAYPIDTFRRLELDLAVMGATRAPIDLATPAAQAHTDDGNDHPGEPGAVASDRDDVASVTMLVPRIAFTRDVTRPGFLFPSSGERFAVAFTAGRGVRSGFVTVLADWRSYVSFGARIAADAPFSRPTFALRLSGAVSAGGLPPTYFSGGVLNWMNPGLGRSGSIPIDGPDDFLFAAPVAPLRGFGLNDASGDRFVLVNAEFRIPLAALRPPGPVPALGTYRLEMRVFADGAMLGGGSHTPPPAVRNPGHPESPGSVSGVLVGAGVGLRMLVLGIPVGMDVAWPVGRAGGHRTYVSLGLDF